jgi:lysophospholipase L1-like esterase
MEEHLPEMPANKGALRGRTVVCHGDSLTWGFMVQREESYPSRLERDLGPPWRVVNTGECGDTAEGGLSRLASQVLTTNPRLVLIGFGANDFYDCVPAKRAFEALGSMVARVLADGAQCVLWGFPLSEAWAEGYLRIARERGVPLLDFLHPDVYGVQGNVFADGVHLTAGGYAAVERRALPVVRRMLAP